MVLTRSHQARDDAQFQDIALTVPIPVEQEGSLVPRLDPRVVKMEKTGVLEGTGYSLYAAGLKVKPGKMYATIMSYGLSGRGGVRDVEITFVLWKGLGGCPWE